MIDALLLSVDDPQLPEGLAAIKNQTVPFGKLIHLNNVAPENRAFNEGMQMVDAEWVMYIGGDMILDKDAVELITTYMKAHSGENISGYYFGLWDSFLECKVGYIGVLRSSIYKKVKFQNSMTDDGDVVRDLRSKGWVTQKLLDFIVGTHCHDPNDLQVFRRCYVHGVRFNGNRSIKGRLIELLKETGNPLYQLGIDAIEFARIKKYYPGAHDVNFDKQNFEEFKIWNQ